MNRLFALLLIFVTAGVVENSLAAPIRLYLTPTAYQDPDTLFIKDGKTTTSLDIQVDANLIPIDSEHARLLLTKPFVIKALRNGAETSIVLRFLDIDVGPDNSGLMEYITKMSSGPHFYLNEKYGSRDEFLAASAKGSLVDFVNNRNDLPHILLLDNQIGFYVTFEELVKNKVKLPNTRISFRRVLEADTEVVSIDSSTISMDYSYLTGIRPTELFDEKNVALLERLRRVQDLYFQMSPPFLGAYTDKDGRKMVYIKRPEDPLQNVVQFPNNSCIDELKP